jgi:hypothetical protein
MIRLSELQREVIKRHLMICVGHGLDPLVIPFTCDMRIGNALIKKGLAEKTLPFDDGSFYLMMLKPAIDHRSGQ